MRRIMLSKGIVAAAVVGGIGLAGLSPALAEEPANGADISGKTVFVKPNGYLRYGTSLLSRVYSHTKAALEIKGRGACTAFNCPVVHNGVDVYVRRTNVTLDRPSGPVVTERTLRRGDDGSDVKVMQEALIKKGGYKIEADGNFGSGTEDAVRDFQTKNNITPDGEIGQQTREKLKV